MIGSACGFPIHHFLLPAGHCLIAQAFCGSGSMPCTPVDLPGGGRAIVCTPTRRCKCKRRMTRECDWKVPGKKSGTCDAPLCDRCTTVPAPGKDLCAKHAAEWKARQAAKTAQPST